MSLIETINNWENLFFNKNKYIIEIQKELEKDKRKNKLNFEDINKTKKQFIKYYTKYTELFKQFIDKYKNTNTNEKINCTFIKLYDNTYITPLYIEIIGVEDIRTKSININKIREHIDFIKNIIWIFFTRIKVKKTNIIKVKNISKIEIDYDEIIKKIIYTYINNHNKILDEKIDILINKPTLINGSGIKKYKKKINKIKKNKQNYEKSINDITNIIKINNINKNIYIQDTQIINKVYIDNLQKIVNVLEKKEEEAELKKELKEELKKNTELITELNKKLEEIKDKLNKDNNDTNKKGIGEFIYKNIESNNDENILRFIIKKINETKDELEEDLKTDKDDYRKSLQKIKKMIYIKKKMIKVDKKLNLNLFIYKFKLIIEINKMEYIIKYPNSITDFNNPLYKLEKNLYKKSTPGLNKF
tara:strand:- start:5333 stop:6586 length:1254 start_codon:yes stop_codon:yes gene_type:complete